MYRLNHHIWGNQRPGARAEKLLLLYLLDRSDQNGVCWPSLQTISRDTGLSRCGVQKVLKRLRDAGYLSWEQDGYSNTYRLNLDRLDRREATRLTPGVVATSCTQADQVATPRRRWATQVAYPGNLVAGVATQLSPGN